MRSLGSSQPAGEDQDKSPKGQGRSCFKTEKERADAGMEGYNFCEHGHAAE